MEKLKVLVLAKNVDKELRKKFSVTTIKSDNLSMASYFKHKMDFIFIGDDVNKEEYFSLVSRLQLTIKDKPFITTKPTDRTIATLKLKGRIYCIEPAMESLIFNHRVITDFQPSTVNGLLGDIHMIRLASRPGIPNVNGYTYTKEALDNGVNKELIKELLKNNSLYAEYGNGKDKIYSMDRASTIDLRYVIGTVVAMSDKYLFIKENKNYQTHLPLEDSSYLAYMRYMAKCVDDNKVCDNDINIITWDISDKSDLPKKYLASLEDNFEYDGVTGSVEYNEHDDIFHGKLLSILGTLANYEADTIEELEKEFRSTVDEYKILMKEMHK